MIEIKTLEIAGFVGTLNALRLPFGKECRSNVDFNRVIFNANPLLNDNIEDPTRYDTFATVKLDPKDLQLLKTLILRGDEHAKVLRGVQVWFEVNAPRFWHVEMDTYSVGAERLSSESTMHIQGKGLSEEELIEMKSHLEEGTMQRRVWMVSYQTLRRIYFQRRNHRLPHWRMFCEWIKTLPFAEELITLE